MFTAIIVDDEKPILRLMEKTLSKNINYNVIGGYTSSKEALENILKLNPNVVFLDIEMPGISGIELAKQILDFNEDIQIIFVTAYENYAIDAFKVNAVDYILKPITQEEINRVTLKLKKKHGLQVNINEQDNSAYVICFGNIIMKNSKNKMEVKWSTSKTKELFAYFIYKNGQGIDKWELCEVLWPERDKKKTEHNLHNTIYRLKNSIKEAGIVNCINYKHGYYFIDFSKFECDLFEFHKFIREGVKINQQNVDLFEKKLSLYTAELFGCESYNWSIDYSETLKRSYSEGLIKISDYYFDNQEYFKAEERLKKLLHFNLYDERAHELLLKIYFHIGNRIDFLKHYDKMYDIFSRELNLEPNQRIKKMRNML
jgi:two-component SAPR family response regulator